MTIAIGCAGSQNLPEPRWQDGASQTEVANQPVLLETVIVDVLTERPSCEAVAAVGADGIACPDRDRLAISANTAQCDRVAVLLDLRDRDALADVNGGQRLVVAVEDGLYMRLEHHVERCPASRGRVVVLKVNEGLAGTVDPFVTALDFRAAADLIDQAQASGTCA